MKNIRSRAFFTPEGGSPIARWLGLSIPNRIARLTVDRWFDREYGVQTAGSIDVRDMGDVETGAASHATAYQPVSLFNLRLMQRGLGPLRPEAFIDIGCGKGRACFFAAANGIGDEVIGVDFSERLLHDARRNLSAFRSHRGSAISFVHADARTFDLPARRSVVFMFNPFDAEILREFAVRNLEHFRRHESVLAYANDVHARVLADIGMRPIRRFRPCKLSIWACSAGPVVRRR